MPYVVGLTGGIGSGKSTVADLFVARGAALVDTDAIAHELTGPHGAAMAAIAEAFQLGFVMHQDVILWPYYDAIRCPTLVIRGAESDLLPREALAEMARRGPQAWTREIPGVGHAPMFQDPAQVAVVREFLLGA